MADEYFNSILNHCVFKNSDQLIKSFLQFLNFSLIHQEMIIQRNFCSSEDLNGTAVEHDTKVYHNPVYLNITVSLDRSNMIKFVFLIINVPFIFFNLFKYYQ